MKILRKPEVLDRTGWSNPTLYNKINDGLFPPGFSIGKRAVGWLDTEVDKYILAMVAGESADELRVLVKKLLLERKGAA